MTLTPLAECIDDIEDYVHESKNYERGFKLIVQRKEFGKLPLELWMFIPCDKDGKPLEKPDPKDYIFENHPELPGNPVEYDNGGFMKALEEYQQAESRVLFKGWSIEPVNHGRGVLIKDGKNAIVFDDSEIILGWSDKIKTIESISHLNLILTKAGENELL